MKLLFSKHMPLAVPICGKSVGKKENEENQLLQFVHQEGLHLVYEDKIPRQK